MINTIFIRLLQPFIKMTRYGALKVMKRLRRPDDQRPMLAMADYMLDEKLFASVFRLFRDEKFHELARFRKLPVAEHDRIFNELMVSGICAALFCIDSMKHLAPPGEFHFWKKVEQAMPKQFQMKLVEFGVDGANAKLMRELITMRYEEYERIANKTLDLSIPRGREFVEVATRAMAVGTSSHIKCGKLLPDPDPLIIYLTHAFLDLQQSLINFVRRV